MNDCFWINKYYLYVLAHKRSSFHYIKYDTSFIECKFLMHSVDPYHNSFFSSNFPSNWKKWSSINLRDIYVSSLSEWVIDTDTLPSNNTFRVVTNSLYWDWNDCSGLVNTLQKIIQQKGLTKKIWLGRNKLQRLQINPS